jgi:hypothetical protein
LRFQSSGHETILRFDGPVTALCLLGFVTRPFDFETPLSECRVVLGFKAHFGDDGRLDSSRSYDIEECVGDGYVDLTSANA